MIIRLSDAVAHFFEEAALLVEAYRTAHFKKPVPVPNRAALGQSFLKSEEDSMLVYQQEFGNLPPATGNNKDIAYGEFVVIANDVAQMSQRVDYDLVTRAPLGPLEWSVNKGENVQLQLKYIDDDGMASEAFTFDFGMARDTIPPDAPDAIGTTTLLREED